jgi:hypothetical protein
MDKPLLRHLLASLAYRFGNVVHLSPEEYALFEPGSQIRSPLHIVAHMSQVLGYALSQLDNHQKVRSTPATWAEEIEAFYEIVKQLDIAIANSTLLDAQLASQLIQGPISDALTHVGQLAMIRRMTGQPVSGENFFIADITIGKLRYF